MASPANSPPLGGRPILALDTASPVVSVAIGAEGRVVGERQLALRRSAEGLLVAIEQSLADAGLDRSELAGIVVLQGPGSFTGLRIGLATALGLHQSLDVPTTALPTLPVLAHAASLVSSELLGQRVTAVVDALRGEWMAQTFDLTTAGAIAIDQPTLVDSEVLESVGAKIIGYGISEAGLPPARCLDPPPLAPVALALAPATANDYDPGRLIQPIYFRPPAVSTSKKDPAPPAPAT